MNKRAWGQEQLLYAVSAAGSALLVWNVASEALGMTVMGERKTLAWMALALAACGIVMLRRLPADRARPPIARRLLAVLVGLAVVGAVAYAGSTRLDRLVLRDRVIEALTIALPEGKEAPNPEHAAKIVIGEVGGYEIYAALISQIGEFSDAAARALAEAGAASVGAKAIPAAETFVVGAGLSHRAFRITASTGDMWAIVFSCGQRIYALMVVGEGGDELARRIVASVRCNATADEAQAGIPAVVDLPPTWQRAAGEPGELMYQTESEVLSIRAIDLIAADNVQGTVDAAARQMGRGAKLIAKHEVVGPDGAHPVWTGTTVVGGQTIAFAMSMWPCPARKRMLLTFHGGLDESAGLELFKRVRCARPDEPMTQ